VVDPKSFISTLKGHGVNFFAGVPDSLLMSLCAELFRSVPAERHIIAANEGAAIGLAAGWHLGTNSTPCVYMQNSGLGNAVNPLVSLADADVYGIPLLLVIGWRGEMLDGRQLRDEPQHVKQGRITRDMLSCLEIPHAVLGPDTLDYEELLVKLARQARHERRPTAILVRKDTFGEADPPTPSLKYELSREDALAVALKVLPDDNIIVSTTGKLSRELNELRISQAQSTDRDFLTVGSMGHALQIASGLALAQPLKRIICIDGDGAMIMHMGGLTTSAKIPNLLHIVINNGAHESVGGQPTQGFRIDMPAIAKACGYTAASRVASAKEIREAIKAALAAPAASFIEIRTRTGARANLGRPKSSPAQSKLALMRSLGVQT
jgi:phosphonopyruvate decarboxylase